MVKLFLVRHGESEWNKLGLWTGFSDVSLSQKGREEAKKAGELLLGDNIDKVYTSNLKRAIETFEQIRTILDRKDLDYTKSEALNERDYGDYTGKNKWQIKEEVGDVEFQKIRRGWDVSIPNGESLKNVYERVVPYFENNIKKDLVSGKNVLITAHGNSLRALMKYLENIEDDRIADVEIETGEVVVYDLDEKDFSIINKNVLKK